MSGMTRTAARELALRLIYEMTFSDLRAEGFLAEHLTDEAFAVLEEEDKLYEGLTADDPQLEYVRKLISGVDEHGPELDEYIARYAVGWEFARIPRLTAAILRVAMFELMYMPEIPHAAAINEAVELAKTYTTEETASFVNGILGSFLRKECGEVWRPLPASQEPTEPEGPEELTP